MVVVKAGDTDADGSGGGKAEAVVGAQAACKANCVPSLAPVFRA